MIELDLERKSTMLAVSAAGWIIEQLDGVSPNYSAGRGKLQLALYDWLMEHAIFKEEGRSDE